MNFDTDKHRNVIPNPSPVILSEAKNLVSLLRAGSVRNLGFEILRVAQNDSNAVICENLCPVFGFSL